MGSEKLFSTEGLGGVHDRSRKRAPARARRAPPGRPRSGGAIALTLNDQDIIKTCNTHREHATHIAHGWYSVQMPENVVADTQSTNRQVSKD